MLPVVHSKPMPQVGRIYAPALFNRSKGLDGLRVSDLLQHMRPRAPCSAPYTVTSQAAA